MQARVRVLLGLVVLTFAMTALSAERGEVWPAWRGPTGDGVAQGEAYPTSWSADQNLGWRIELPEPGNSTPVVWGDHVFLTQPLAKDRRRTLICFDRKAGKQLWQAGVDYADAEPTHETNPYCSPSPVTDGERVIVWYGSAGLACYDFDGNEVWRRETGPVEHMWGSGTSPVLYKNLCILSFGPGNREYLLAVDKRTGEDVWLVESPADKLPPGIEAELVDQNRPEIQNADKPRSEQLRGSWATPVITTAGGRDELIVLHPGSIASYEPSTGKLLWSSSGLGILVYSSPMIVDNMAIALGGYQTASLGVRLGGNGDVTESHRVWRSPRSKLRLGTGVFKDGYLYISDMEGIAQCLDPKSGKVQWEQRLRGPGGAGQTWSSLMLAGDNIYSMNQAGDTFVFKAKPKFELVATNSLNEPTNSSVVGVGGELYLRTHAALWCIREKSQQR